MIPKMQSFSIKVVVYSCKCVNNGLRGSHQNDILNKYENHYIAFRLKEVGAVEVSYKKLWKLLIDKDMKKKDLQQQAGVSWSSVTKLSKGETVSMEVMMKVCKALNCDIGDVMELIPTPDDVEE